MISNNNNNRLPPDVELTAIWTTDKSTSFSGTSQLKRHTTRLFTKPNPILTTREATQHHNTVSFIIDAPLISILSRFSSRSGVCVCVCVCVRHRQATGRHRRQQTGCHGVDELFANRRRQTKRPDRLALSLRLRRGGRPSRRRRPRALKALKCFFIEARADRKGTRRVRTVVDCKRPAHTSQRSRHYTH